MKSVLLFFLVTFISLPGKTQTETDSLDLLISKAVSDTEKIKLQNRKLSRLNNNNLDSGIAYGLRLVEDAHSAGFLSGEAEALMSLSFAYSVKGKYDFARGVLRRASDLLTHTTDSGLFASLYGAYGTMYGIQGKYDSSIQVLEKAIHIAEKIKDFKNLKTYYGNIAIGYQQISDFPAAISYQIKSLKLANENKDIRSQAHTLLNMGITYSEMQDYNQAKKYILEALEKARLGNLLNVQLYGASNLASVYPETDDWQKSYDYAVEAASLARQLKDVGIESASLSKAVIALSKLEKYEEGETLGKRMLQLADSSGQPVNIMQAYVAMGILFSDQGRYRESIPYFTHAAEFIHQTDMYNQSAANLYRKLSRSYEMTQHFEKALDNYKRSAEITDSIRRKENVMKATRLSMNYEFEKKQNQLKAEQDKKDAAAKTRNLIILGAAGLLLIIALFAWVALRNKQRANRQLLSKNKEIRKTLKKLRETQAQLIQSEKMASMGELTAGIAHEIQNPLNFVNNFSELNIEMIRELLAERSKEVRVLENEEELLNNIKENENRINFHGKRADAIVKSMLQHSRKSTGSKEHIDLNALADEYLRLGYHGLRAKDKSFNVTMRTDFDPVLPRVSIIPQEMGRVFLNLFNNAFYAVSEKKKKYPDFDPVVTVSTSYVGDNRVIIKIRDNGTGIPAAAVDKIFQPFFTTKPTREGTGLGLSLSYDIVKSHTGSLEVFTEEGEFTEFVISLPISKSVSGIGEEGVLMEE